MANQMIVEPFQCAAELFWEGRKTDDHQAFPFGGCEDDHEDCTIDQYRFPQSLDLRTETIDTNTQRYEAISRRLQCDPGYEIDTPEECAVAGLAVGGFLLHNERPVEGSWGHTPLSFTFCAQTILTKHDC